LPGKSLVVLEPESRLAIDIFLCEDGHAQEHRLFVQVLETVEPQQLLVVPNYSSNSDRLSPSQWFMMRDVIILILAEGAAYG
jgi:hypothetical protein